MGSKVEIEVGLKSGLVSTGLTKIRGQFQQLRAHLNSDIGTAISVGGIIAGVTSIATGLDRIKDMSDRFGETAESMQRVDAASKLFGTDLEGVAKAMGKVSLSALKAVRDGGDLKASFEGLGIDAASFINLPLQDKLTALSAAYLRVQGSGEGLARMMDLLGRSAGELVPLLSQGPEALQQSFDAALVASQSAVDSVDRLFDALSRVKSAAALFFGTFVQGVLTITAAWGVGVAAMIGIQKAFFTGAKDGWLTLGTVIKSVLTGNLVEAKNAALEFPKIFSSAMEQSKNSISGAGLEMREQWDKIWGEGEKPMGPAGGISVVDEAAANEAAEKAKKGAEDAKKRAEEIANLKVKLSDSEHENLLRNLAIEERITQLVRDRAGLVKAAAESTDEKEQLETKLKIADVDRDIQRAGEELADNQKRADEDMAAKEKRLAELVRENQLKKLKPEEQLEQLKGEIKNLDEEIRQATSPETEIELKIKREETKADAASIESQLDKAANNFKGVSADFLAEIGGGGGTGSAMDPVVFEQKQGNKLLERIEANTRDLTKTSSDLMMKP